MTDSPNILFLFNDHQAYYRHGWDSGVRPLTPNFDRLAAEGVQFERSYCVSPLCGPSRRTMLTGLYPHNHRNVFNYTNSPYDHEVYLDVLAERGYRNYYYGKWHAGVGTAYDFNCEGFSITDYGNPYITREYLDYLEEHELPRAEHLIEYNFMVKEPFVSQFPNLKAGELYREEAPWCGGNAVGITVTPKETHEAFFLATLTCEKLEELAASGSSQPFHLRVDFWGPHQPFFPTQEFVDLYNPDDIQVYGNFQDTLENKPSFYRRAPGRPDTDENDELILPNPMPWSDWQIILSRAYAQITLVDAAGGMVLDKLEELGLAENTLVIWTTDHGDALASHGGHIDKGSYLTEEVMRVPLAMRYPGMIPAGQTRNELVCGIDIPSTILDAAGTGFKKPVDGESLLPLAKGETPDWRDSLMVETYGLGFGAIFLGRGVIKGPYKYIANQEEIDELYHLEEDPYELHNLIDDSEYQNVASEMKAELAKWLKESGDTDFEHPVSQTFIDEDRKLLLELLERRKQTDLMKHIK
jgi:arylsulfatase A-like enzyme